MAANLATCWIRSGSGEGLKPGDVLGDRAGEQPVVLQHAADLGAIRLEPDRLQRNVVDQHRAGGRAQQPGEDLQQRRLARARGSGDRDAFAGGDIEVEIAMTLGSLSL